MKNPINILSNLLTPERGIIASIFFGLTLSIIPALLISTALYFILGSDGAPLAKGDLIISLIQIGLLAPFIETIIMWPILNWLMKITRGDRFYAALVSALLWATFHGLFSFTWGLTIFWPFLIFSLVFLNWKPKGIIYALGVTISVHALQNILAVLYMHFG